MKRKITPLLIIFTLLFFAKSFSQQNLTHWINHVSSPDILFGEGVTADPEGNAYISGFFKTRLALNQDTLQVASIRNSLFFSKISPDNETIWTVTAEADGIQGVNGSKSVYKNGFIYLLGDFRGETVFGSADFTEITLNAEFRSFFIAKYRDNGVLEWVKPITTTNSIGFVTVGGTHGLAVDDYGGVYLSTGFRNSVNIAGVEVKDPTPFENLGNALVFKLDANGAYQWHWNSTFGGTDNAMAINVNQQDQLYFTVRYSDTLDINGNTSARPDQGGLALVEFDLQGNYQSHLYMATEDDLITGVRCFALEFDPQQDIYMAGSYRTDIFIGPGAFLLTENPVRSDGFIIKINGDTKEWEWAKNYGNPEENDEIKSLIYGEDDNFLMAGNFRGTMQLSEDISLTSIEESTDGFWAAADIEGNILQAMSFGSGTNDAVNQMAVAPQMDAYVIGRYQNTFNYDETTFNAWGSFDVFLIKLRQPSSNANLQSVSFNNEPFPDFNPETTEYLISLPHATIEVPETEATPASSFAEVLISQATSVTGTQEERTASVMVTSEDETTQREYAFTFRLMNNDTTLVNIFLDGNELENFDSQTFEYEYIVPYDEEFPEITALAADENASVTVSEFQAPEPDGFWGKTEISVVAEDPDYTAVYTINMRMQHTNALLQEILIDGSVFEYFDPEVFTYQIDYIPGDNQHPTVEATAQSPFATHITEQVTDISGTEEQRTATISVTAEASSFVEQYNLIFSLGTQIQSFSEQQKFALYPNPASKNLKLTFTEIPVEVRLSDIKGQLLLKTEPGSHHTLLPVSDLQNGIYFIRVIFDEGSETRPFIKQ